MAGLHITNNNVMVYRIRLAYNLEWNKTKIIFSVFVGYADCIYLADYLTGAHAGWRHAQSSGNSFRLHVAQVGHL